MVPRPLLIVTPCLITLALGACGGSDSPSALVTEPPGATLVGTLPPGTIPTDITLPPATSVPTTPATEATTSTAPPTLPTLPPTTTATTVDPANELLLSAVGLGPHAFGTSVDAVLGDLEGRFGAPGSDDSLTFVSTAGDYISDDGCCSFVAPVGRTVCWPNGLCATFAGSTSESLGFVGWRYGDDEFSSLHSAAGITLGSRWADFLADMNVFPGGCYTVGGGTTADGIELVLQGGDFEVVGDDGSFTPVLPAPESVTVIGMAAGDEVVDLASDC